MKIGELAARSGVNGKTIRFYEQSGLLPEPPRAPNGYRDYGPEIAERLGFIRHAQRAGLSLREVAEILEIHDRGDLPCGHVRHVLTERLEQVRARIAELAALEARLAASLARSRQPAPTAGERAGVCWILEHPPAGGTVGGAADPDGFGAPASG